VLATDDGAIVTTPTRVRGSGDQPTRCCDLPQRPLCHSNV